jgi:hypothetical protein
MSEKKDFIVVPAQSYVMFEKDFLDLKFTQIYKGSEVLVVCPDERDVVVTSDAIFSGTTVTAGDPYVAWHYAYRRGHPSEMARGLSPQDAFYNLVTD